MRNKRLKSEELSDHIGFYFRKEAKILLIISVTGIFYNLGMIASPWFEGQMVQLLCNILGKKQPPSDMTVLVILYVLTIFFVQGMRCLKRLYVRKFANNISRRMKRTLYLHLLRQKKANQEKAGDLMTKIISDADACVEGMRKFTTEIFDTGVVMIAYLSMLLFYDWKLTLLSMLFPPAACLLAEKLKVTVTKNTALCRESSADLNAASLERISHALTYRIYGQETHRNEIYETVLSDYEKKAVRANLWENAMPPIYQVISMLGTILILWFGGKNVMGTGWNVWNLAAFTTYFSCYQKLAVKSSKAAKLVNAVQKARVSWRRIRPYLSPISEEPNAVAVSGGTLIAKKICFSYPGQKPLFSKVSFQAFPGEILGVTGTVACGKSTLGKILTGELPYQGEIFLGNRLFSNKGDHYESCVGYLGHEPELFSGTIEENIRLGKPGDLAPVLQAVCIDREIETFPDGIHTIIGNGGIRLSGGQQTRIALARTLYHQKPLMILDDPFSAVDQTTETCIFANLRILCKNSILILISHRLSLFPQMDRILYLENQTVSVAGHEELLRTAKHYRILYETQKQEDNSK